MRISAASFRENWQILEKQARELWQGQAARRATKAAKPTDPRAKHLAKLRKLMKGDLPTLSELSFNGVMERAGIVRWCAAASDGRPILPFETKLIVARGSFLYLFSGNGDVVPSSRSLSAICVYGAKCIAMPLYQDDRTPQQRHLIAVRLSMLWQRRQMIFLQLRDHAQMAAWVADLQRRAQEDSSRSALRTAIYKQSADPDPSLAEGMLAVRKDMNRASTEHERVRASKGIGQETQALAIASSGVATSAGHAVFGSCRAASAGDSGECCGDADASGSDAPLAREPMRTGVDAAPLCTPLDEVLETMATAEYGDVPRKAPVGQWMKARDGRDVRRTRIAKAIRRAEIADGAHGQQELVASNVFGGVYVYTPRGIHGSADDIARLHPAERQRQLSLAQSTREAVAANAKLDQEARQHRLEWLAGRAAEHAKL